MQIQLRKAERQNLSITFELSPFITAWDSAETTFMAAVVRELGDLLSVRPRDFHSNDSAELGESRCTYRIFGGASTVVLSPETLQLNFGSLAEADYPTVYEIVHRSINILSRDLGCYAKDHVTINASEHVPAVNHGAVDSYLAQFAWKEPADIAAADIEIEYSPGAKITLSDRLGRWSLHRTVEKSVFLTNGVFVTTMILLRSNQLTPIEDQRQLWVRIDSLGDQAMGLTYLGEDP